MADQLGGIGWDGKQPGALLGRQQSASGHVGLQLTGEPFINSLPFDTIPQQGIESENARNRRAR